MIQYTVKVSDHRTEWYNEGKLHREDGPAMEWADGTKAWYKEGQRHRLNGPAREWPDGTNFWYKEGKKHRLDGPAIERPNGDKEWFLNDVKVTEDEVMNPTKELTMTQLEELLGYKVKVVK